MYAAICFAAIVLLVCTRMYPCVWCKAIVLEQQDVLTCHFCHEHSCIDCFGTYCAYCIHGLVVCAQCLEEEAGEDEDVPEEEEEEEAPLTEPEVEP